MQTHTLLISERRNKKKLFSFWLYGKVPLTLFIISIIILIVSIAINYYQIPIPLLGLIFTPILTSLLVILINIHNSIKKNDLFLDLLIDEIGHNILTLKQNNHTLKKEREFFKDNLYSIGALYPLKFDIWKYSVNNMSINQFKRNIMVYNSFIFEAVRYNENIIFRNNMNPLIYQNEFLKTRKKNNDTLSEIGKSANARLTLILKNMGNLSIIDTEFLKNQDEIINQLKEDGFSPEQIKSHMRDIDYGQIENTNLFIILYYY